MLRVRVEVEEIRYKGEYHYSIRMFDEATLTWVEPDRFYDKDSFLNVFFQGFPQDWKERNRPSCFVG